MMDRSNNLKTAKSNKLFHRRPTINAWIAVIFTAGFLLFLGSWQVQRLFWKEGLIAQIEQANVQTPLQGIPENLTDIDTIRFRTITLYGRLDPTIQFHVTPRHYKGKLGYHIFSPITLLESNKIVLVNRGWVKADDKEIIASEAYNTLPPVAHYTGMIRTSNERNPFTPDNQPEKNVWFGRDIKQMAAHAKLANVAPITVDLLKTASIDNNQQAHPIPVTGEIKLMNNHLGYAITWFSLAIIAVVVFVMYHRERR